MNYFKELETLQTWIKKTAGLNSLRLKEAKPKLPRPVVLWETPDRSKDRNVGNYLYINKVRQYGRLFVADLEEALKIQEKLIQDMENRRGTLVIKDNGVTLGYIQRMAIEFNNSDALDIPFSITYEVTYARSKPEQAPPASVVTTKLTVGN